MIEKIITAINDYLPQIIATAVVFILLPLSRRGFCRLTVKYGKFTLKSEQRILQMKHIIRITINVFFFIVLAIIWGVRPQNLLIGLSSVFAVVGVAFFAQWSILSNVTAAIIMFFGAPYHVGDKITIIDKDLPIDARIESILAFYTHLRTDDNRLIVLPNNLFLQKIVSIKNEDPEEEDV